MSSLQQIWRRGQNRFCLDARELRGRGKRQGAGEEMAQTMYAHMNKRIKKHEKISRIFRTGELRERYQESKRTKLRTRKCKQFKVAESTELKKTWLSRAWQ
jgi:hypothetical protein